MHIKFKSLALVTLLISLLLHSCGSDDDPSGSPSGNLPVSQLSISDMGNTGDASDIYLELDLSSITNITSLRILVSEGVLTLDEAVASSNFDELSIASSQSIKLNSNLRTVQGDPVVEELMYNIYILGIFQNEDFSAAISSAENLTLENATIVMTPDLTGDFNAMEDVVISADGGLYVNGGGNNASVIYKVSPEGSSSIFYDGLQQGVGITLDGNGNVYASNFQGDMITKITPAGEGSDFVTSSKLSGGGGLSFDNEGNLYNAFAASPTVFKIEDGEVSDYITSSSLISPIGIAYDEIRNVFYIGSFTTGEIYQLSSDLELTTIADIPASIGHLAYANDHLYATGWNEHQVFKVSITGELVSTIGSGQVGNANGDEQSAQFNQPNGIDVTEDGSTVYVSQGGGGILRKIIMDR